MSTSSPDLDAADALAPARAAFALAPELLYFNGNSLGPCTYKTIEHMRTVVEKQWGIEIIRGWNTAGWIDLPLQTGEKLSKILGAASGQSIVCDSTSINLYKLLSGALARHPTRKVVLLERGAFPTDNYIAQGIATREPRLELREVSARELPEALSDEVAAVVFSHVNYRSGERVDIPAMQRRAAHYDIPVVWDLAHSAGAVPLHLDDWGVEYAVGCGYKFLNGGPGAPGFAYVATRRIASLEPVLQGWFGHQQPFAFDPRYRPEDSIRRLQVGTPPILSMSALDSALDFLNQFELGELWVKSCRLFAHFMQALERTGLDEDFQLLTPRDPEARGSQISLEHPHAHEICRALAARGVIADYREPGVLRFALTPLYMRFQDVDSCVDHLATIMQTENWRRPEFRLREKVT